MQKIHWLIIGMIILIIASVSIFVISSVSSISTPKVTVEIDAMQLTDEQMDINIILTLDNQNDYTLILKDLQMDARTAQNNQIGLISFPRKTIPPHEKITIRTSGSFCFNNESLQEFISHISGEFGINLMSFPISLPLDISIITDPTPLIDTLILPTVSLNADVQSINETGVLINGTINVKNQNKFSMELKNNDIIIQHNETTINADISITDTIIKAESESSIFFSAFVGYEILDRGTLSASMNGDVDLSVAGIALSRPFSATAEIKIPDIAQFLMDNERIIIALSTDLDATLTGINMNIGFKLYNPTKIPLTASELEIMLIRIDGDNQTTIAQDTLENCPFPEEKETCMQTTFKLPLTSFVPIIGNGIPDWFLIRITGDFTIADSNQHIPIQINGFVSTNLLSNNPLQQEV